MSLTAINRGSGLSRSNNITSDWDPTTMGTLLPSTPKTGANAAAAATAATAATAAAIVDPAPIGLDLNSLVTPMSKIKVSQANAEAHARTLQLWEDPGQNEEWYIDTEDTGVLKPVQFKKDKKPKEAALDAAVRRAQFQSRRNSSRFSLSKTSFEEAATGSTRASGASGISSPSTEDASSIHNSMDSDTSDFFSESSTKPYQTAANILKSSIVSPVLSRRAAGNSRSNRNSWISPDSPQLSLDRLAMESSSANNVSHSQIANSLNVKVIADFKILGLLGGGAFSSVYFGKRCRRFFSYKKLFIFIFFVFMFFHLYL